MSTCVWVKADGAPCGQPTTYRMVWDGGEVGAGKVRQYDHLCLQHRAELTRQERLDDHGPVVERRTVMVGGGPRAPKHPEQIEVHEDGTIFTVG